MAIEHHIPVILNSQNLTFPMFVFSMAHLTGVMNDFICRGRGDVSIEKPEIKSMVDTAN